MSDASTDVDNDLRKSILHVVSFSTDGLQPDTVVKHVVIENWTRRGTTPATVRDVLTTLVEDGEEYLAVMKWRSASPPQSAPPDCSREEDSANPIVCHVLTVFFRTSLFVVGDIDF